MTETPSQDTKDRLLIVNGDDFGRTPGINAGIIRAHERGILTSASLMVRWPAAAEAAAYSGNRSSLSLGLHLDLGEWVYRDGEWQLLYAVVDSDDGDAVRAEVARQLEAFADLAGRHPTHIDSHQHVHLHEPVRSAALAACRRIGVPLRGCCPAIAYQGGFYGQSGKGDPWPEGITVDNLVRIIADLAPGITEMSCHPGEADDFDSVYRTERSIELAVLCDARVRRALAAYQVRLSRFRLARTAD